jgi:hypothetical protein
MNRIDLSSAEFTVNGAAFSYGNGIYWFPSHEFNVFVPTLTITSPQVTRNFTMTNKFPGGMGYFAVNSEKPPLFTDKNKISEKKPSR